MPFAPRWFQTRQFQGPVSSTLALPENFNDEKEKEWGKGKFENKNKKK
jgi:hypothetical protein